MGDRTGKIRPAPIRRIARRHQEEPPRNLNSYRITDADRLGDGGPKQKFQQNLKAIQTLRALDAEERPATAEEKAVLVKYVGWGAMPQVFDDYNREWAKERATLQANLSEAEYERARSTTLNAHYTSPTVIGAMYRAAERFGFKGGRVLEPACGIGHFIGIMPEDVLKRSTVTAVEIDPLTARIAKALYPDVDVRAQPFEQTKLADGFYDVAISNVPFGDYTVHDPRWNSYKLPIHDYFFASALEKVRPGGLVMFITSRGTMDKLDSTLRELLSTRTELLGAVRLPNDAFKRNAGTEVTTDIVMLRKLRPGESPSGPAWKETASHTNDQGENFTINEYFAARPEMMLGRMRLTGRMYRDNEPTLEADGRSLGEALAQAVERLPEGVYQVHAHQIAEPTIEETIPAPDFVKPNAFCLHEGMVCIREENILRPLNDLPSETRSRIRGLIPVRDAVRDCLRAQVDGSAEERVVETRQQLNLAYDRFTARFGPVNLRANQRAFDGDPDLPLLLSLENYNDETKRATKATIFTERTIHHRQPIESAGSPKEALLVSLNERGCVDLDHMAGLLNKPVEEFLPDLKGIIFRNPQTNDWETDDQYLSGNVREKLAVADAAAVTDPRFAENVEALKSVQPADLAATEIDVRLGAAWLPPEDVRDFTNGLLNIPSGVEIGHIHALGAWHINGNWEAKGATANTTDWGTDRYTALELIEDALNLKTPSVYDLNEDKKPMINAQATEAAREKQERIKERFKEWVWSDDSRRERLCRLYNDTFNHTRVRTFNGDHLTLPGASGAIQLHGHQKAGVWRILQTPNTLLAHVVGAGKTFTMVAAAMELKRLGLARKPMFAVPNHMLGQFSTELLTLYPGANILVAGKEDFESQNRKKLFSRIATGNWDAVIVTHSGFERIPLSQETQERFFKEQLHELEMIKRRHADSSNRRLVKELERAKKRLEARLQALAAEHKKDNTLTFEELGVDRIFVDEAHYFKNLFYLTKMTRIAGLPQTASERAFDMFLKVRHVQSLNGGGGVVFATGTPIANSMAEMFTMQRYLQPDDLKKHNLHHFDSWAATFGEPVTAMELSPDGAGYRLNTRFARFINVPELMQMFRQSADVQTAAMLNLPRPKLDGEKPTIRNAPATPELKAFVQELAARADRLKNGRVDPSEDNMLKITSEGRKAALNLRLMKPETPDEPQGKVNLAVENIHRIWAASATERSAQLVFCDLSTPKDRGFSVYRDMADKLERLGVPTREIAFIQDYDSDASKLALFRDVRSGKVRVLFGSTQKMGSGTNVQERLIALHHLDAPWRPADVEQREGRILRQGNKNAVVSVFRYVTEGSFDAYMWQTLETKAKFIAQVMSGDMTIRRLEDLDSAALTYAEVKAIASGNPLVIEKAQVDAELIRLTRLRSAHAEEQYRIRSNLRRSHEDAEMFTGRLVNLRQDISVRQDTSGDNFRIELDGQETNNRGIAGELILRRAEKLKNRFGDDIRIGRFAGFDLFLRPSFNNTVEVVVRGKNSYAARVTDTALGTIRSLEATVQGFEERAGRLESDIADAHKRAKELEGKVGAHFEKEERYQHLCRRQGEIEEKLDLTKNQAPSQIEAEPAELVEQKASEQHSQKNSQPRHARRAGVHV
ncbi:MAG: DEAD/DEAH box helicase family protein [Verrucomicrobia subdivision 3 bacterium]|nr:DEAD/DEAH box helicase family protein [Limisphaerales bacterium]